MFFDMVISLFGLLRSKHSSRIITTGDNHLRIGIISCSYYCNQKRCIIILERSYMVCVTQHIVCHFL